jgi:hypothetical protein
MLMAATGFAAGAALIVPRGIESGYLLVHQDDPVALADHIVKTSLDPATARREIEAALAAGDIGLARSFLDLAEEQGIAVDTGLMGRIEAANAPQALAARTAGSFAHGFVTGEPHDGAGLAGTALGDLFVFGDIRDALREGSRLAAGEEADELVLGLAGIGLAVTAGTYASLGVGAPARAGVSLVKGALKAGRMSGRLAGFIGRSLRDAVEISAMRTVASRASLLHPVAAVRAAREAVKVERAGGLIRLVEDAGRVQAKAGTRAAMDGLRIAEGPQDMARLARLAEKKGGKTRAILKLGGRAAITLTTGLINLASWLFSAAMMVLGFCSAVKGLTERTTRRWIDRRKAQRARRGARRALAA